MPKLNAFGSTLSREISAFPGTYDPVVNLLSITPPSISREEIDVTDHDSTDGWMEFLPGLKDGGEVSASGNFVPGSHVSLLAEFDSDTVRNWEIALPDGSKWAFSGFLTGFETDLSHDDKADVELSWRVSGKPTFTAAA